MKKALAYLILTPFVLIIPFFIIGLIFEWAYDTIFEDAE
jgi:hypothetical protein